MLTLLLVGVAHADVPMRALPSGAVPNPGTQQQELMNITFPAQWNVFEFVVTCGACHAGSVDQHTGHFGNWAGGNMASGARDPVFRANQIGVNNLVKSLTGLDGSGNVCFRCHSPNGWLSGRFDPTLGGSAEGKTMMHSILLSTDDEGIMCETCHRAVGSVSHKRQDLSLTDKVWNLLAGIFDWEHQGGAYQDQVGDPTVAPGMPYGDTALQYLDGMTYIGKYSGMTDVYFSDVPLNGSYTGQIYAVYPDWWAASGNSMNPVPAGQPVQNSAGQYLAYNLDGTLPPLLEVPVGAPTNAGSGGTNYSYQGIAIEHPTVGGKGRKTSKNDTANLLLPVVPPGPGGSPSPNNFIRTSEFCGSCHDLTVPVLNHGMPEQRTFTEWKFSDFSKASNVGYDPIKKQTWNGEQRCQDCHMPTLRHEYTDLDPGSYNADPYLVGGFPYGKDRSKQGGTAFHKLTGANRDLPMMMKVLYPEVDLEVIGLRTGKDPRPFPGMLSDRGPMWDRAKNNTEITLRDAVEVRISQPPTEVNSKPGVYEMKVRVTNKSGHRIPSGYPDGRRFWLAINVKDASGTAVYTSGVYDETQAMLFTDARKNGFNRALTSIIDATPSSHGTSTVSGNAVMVYERVTGTCVDANGAAIFPTPSAGTPARCAASPALTNNFILFDNRIPPKGFTYQDYRMSGIKFWSYDPATMVPFEQGGAKNSKVAPRYPDSQNWDEVTYRFNAPQGSVLTASAEVYWQTHTREFMEHLRNQDTSTVRPEGPPNLLDPSYPLNPTYLSNSINGKPLSGINDPFNPGVPLNDNWGGVAYAAWLETGKGAPFLVDRDDTSVSGAPAATTVAVRALNSNDPDYIDPVTLAPDSFAAKIEWAPVANADGYTIWIRYGKSDTTADWDRLAVVGKDVTTFTEHVLGDASLASPGKTYGFKVVPFNGKGDGPDSNVFVHKVASALPAAPTNLTASRDSTGGSTASSIKLTWFDNANNENSFELWRYDNMTNGVGSGPMTIIGRIGSQTAGPAGGAPTTGTNTYVDADPALVPGKCYVYQVRAVTPNLDASMWSQPQAQGCTAAAAPTVNLSATAAGGYRVDLSWTTNMTGAKSYRIQRDGTVLGTTTTTSYADTSVQPATTYSYSVQALDAANAVLASGTTSVTTVAAPFTPGNVQAIVTGVGQVTISWVDNATNEDGFVVERAPVTNGVAGGFTPVTPQNGFAPPAAGTGSTQQFVDTTVAQSSDYVYRVMAINLVTGNSLYAYSNQIVAGVAPPTIQSVTLAVATGPFATNSSGGTPSITIKWFDNAVSEDGYEIQRCLGAACSAASVNWTALGGVLPPNTTQAVDNTMTAGNTSQSVTYRVRAVKTVAVPSAWAYSATVAVPPLPGKPGISSITASTDPNQELPRVTVTWSNVADETGYVVERSADGANWTQIAQAAMDATSFIDTSSTGLAGGQTYQYRVTAVGYSGWNTSAAGSITLPAPTTAPTINSVSGVLLQSTQMKVNFSVPAGAVGWQLQRSTAGTNSWVAVSGNTGAGNVTYTDSGLTRNTSYDYRVRTYNSGGFSAWSVTATGTTSPL
ncbi:MAG TPA: hypothetical protein VFK88_04840 [Gallionella sp.]|nr:hypothetical protein [Gallionella sp.]